MTKVNRTREKSSYVSYESCSKIRSNFNRWIIGISIIIGMGMISWAFSHVSAANSIQIKSHTEQEVIKTRMEGIKEDVTDIKTLVREIYDKVK